MVKLIIPAMGASERFRTVSAKPKALLELRDADSEESMISRILSRMPPGVEPMVVCPASWAEEFAGYGVDTVGLSWKTRGQADTIRYALRLLDLGNEPVLVHNCDVLFSREVIEIVSLAKRNTIVVFPDPDPLVEPPPYGYVDDPWVVARLAEKERLSKWAIAGLWRFGNAKTLLACIEETLSCVPNELEISLSRVIPKFGAIRGFPILHHVDLGTPEAVRAAGFEIIG